MKYDNAVSPNATTCDNTAKLFATQTTKNKTAMNAPTRTVACTAIANKPWGLQFPS